MKYYTYTIILIALIIGCFWLFNHVNPWVGIAATLIIIGALLNYIINLNKNQSK